MQPSEGPAWLVVEDEHGNAVSVREYPPRANRINIMIEALASSLAKGWQVEELPGEFPTYFCRKGDRRHCVHIAEGRPADRRAPSRRG